VVGREFGKGSFKSAYKCDWNGTPVVKVKFHMLNQEDKDAQRNFRDELAVVARLAHPNIVQFLGRCKNELAFVVSFCPNGSLFDVLFDSKNPARVAAKKQLTEVVRFKIALGVARAINFLHHCSPPMIHRDLKGSNGSHFQSFVVKFNYLLMLISMFIQCC
jgi:serine/threonine protein kinase